ncbi:MAG TPA: threonine synthase [Dehalococcoidia bacterium]|nr:threonine synthase [Dehalococcoidia bacterium]
MPHVKGLRCRECGKEYPEEPLFFCEYCFGPLEVNYDYDAMARAVSREAIARREPTLWRYKELLPVDGQGTVDFGVGFTPLIRAENLAKALGMKELYLKNDCVNPTYSFKDRVVSVAATKAMEFGFDTLACASTGNLACSVAAHAAKAGLHSYVFIPADLELGKIAGAAVYKPVLVAVDGNYDEVNRLCSELADQYPWAFVNINMRPYYSEGSKTLGFEVAEQLGWRAPAQAVVPVASGSMFTKIWKGFNEMAKLGLIDGVHTRMFVAQAEGSSPIVTAHERHTFNIQPVKPKTIAKSLAIGNPADGYYSLRVIRDSEGGAAAVTDEEVIQGITLLAQTEGIYAETAGGVTIGCLKKLVERGELDRDALTVAYITGAGYKTQEAIVDSLAKPLHIKPTMVAFHEAIGAK